MLIGALTQGVTACTQFCLKQIYIHRYSTVYHTLKLCWSSSSDCWQLLELSSIGAWDGLGCNQSWVHSCVCNL